MRIIDRLKEIKSAKIGKRLHQVKIIFIILIILFIFGMLRSKMNIIKSKSQEIVPVKVMRVKLTTISKMLEYVGDVSAQDEAAVYPKVSGKIMEKIKEDGASVNKGEAIVYIDRDEVGLKFEKAPVESPLFGLIGRMYVDIGTYVDTKTAIAVVINMDKVKVYLDIPEQYLPQINLRQDAIINVDAYPQQEFIGKVTKISPVVDIATRTAPIEILVDNFQHKLNPGMFAKVRLVIEEHRNVPVVLREALIGKEPDIYVFIVEDKEARLQQVKLGLRQGPYYEITDGVKENDLVVIMGQERMREGIEVIAEE